MKSTHIVKSVCKLYDYNTDILAHCKKYLSDILGFLFVLSESFHLFQLCNAVYKHCNVSSEILLQFFQRARSILHNVMKKCSTDSVSIHAKLKKKNADMIVANQVGDGLAFGTDNNEVWLVTKGDDVLLPLMSKRAVAERLVEVVAAHLD